MKKLNLTLASFGILLLLTGAGCEQTSDTLPTEETQVQTKDASDATDATTQNSNPTQTETTPSNTTESSELSLTAEALGNGIVKLKWTAPEGLTEANRFIIVQGSEENPVNDGKHSWFRQFYTSRFMSWTNLAPGTAHFRICLTENHENDTCVKYSNDVVVDVQ